MKFKSEVQLEALNNATIDTDKFLVSNGGTIMFRTGAQLLADIGGSVGGITSLNTQTQSTQTLVVGNEGLDFDIVSNAGQHTFNLPDASLVNRGVVTIGPQGFAGAKTFYEDLKVNSLTVGEGGAIGSTGINNTAIGISALTANTGSNNTAIGYIALANNIGGFQNTAIGANALYTNIGTLNPAYPGDPVQYFGVYNTAVGYEALKLNTSNNNTAVGIRTLASNTTGFQNTAIGSEALLFNTTGEENTAIGKDALRSNVDANWNTAIGSSALQNNTLGFQNTAIGRFTAKLNISGSYNTSIGVDALTANLSSNYNTALGYKAGYTITGARNTFIGGQDEFATPLQLTTANDSIAIGHGAYTTRNFQVVLGNDQIAETLLRGDIKLTTSPTTSPGSYQILTINTVGGPNTGRIESVPSSSIQKTISVGPIDAGANSNGMSLSAGGGLTLHAATSTTGGVVTNGTQTFAGDKTFTGQVNSNSVISVVADSVGHDPYGKIGITRGIASNFAYYGLTRAGNIGWSIGINTTNKLIFGTGATTSDKIITSTALSLDTTGNLTANAFFSSSDSKLKNIIKRDGDTVKFKWKDKRDNKIHIGYIAQEVKKKYPDQVNKGDDGLLTVNYIEVLVAKIQELENRIKILENAN